MTTGIDLDIWHVVKASEEIEHLRLARYSDTQILQYLIKVEAYFVTEEYRD